MKHNILADFHVLKLDLDGKSAKAIETVGTRFVLLEKFFQITRYRIIEKESRHGKHITVTFRSKKQIDDKDLVFMQLFLGSDRNREMFNWLRVRSNARTWNALFRKKFDSKMVQIGEER